MAGILIVIGFVLLAIGIIYLMFHYQKDRSTTSERAQNLAQQKYDPNMTRFAAAKEAKASAARNELLTNVNKEISLVTQTIDNEAQALFASYRKDDAPLTHQIEKEKTLADHGAYVALADNKRVVADMASTLGIDPDTMKELVLERARMETQLSMEYRQMELEVEKHKRMKEVDFNFETQLASLELDMANVANLLPQHKLGLLHTQLSEIHHEYDSIQKLPAGEFKQKELARVKKKMTTWQRDINAQSKRLL